MRNYLDTFRLTGKTVFLAGGAGLIGGEITRAVAQAGAKAVILDINAKKAGGICRAIENEGFDAVYEKFDMANIEGIEKQLKALIKKYNALDVLINAAYPRTKDWAAPLEKTTVKSIRENVDIQLNANAIMCKTAAQIMKTRKSGGSIINFSSIYGVVGNDFTVYENTTLTSPMAYAMIKGGIVNLTRYLASYYGKDGIRVNTICPGGIWQEQDPVFVRRYNKKVPLKRMGKPEEIAAPVLFLASEASSYMTGATIMVDGGWTCI